MMGEAALKRVTVDEFLAWDGEGDRRYELVAGEIVAMSPPSSYHGVIAMRTGIAIGQKLKPPCQVISEAGIRFHWRNDAYYQADLVVTYTPLKRGEWGAPDPIVIVEVLSPTTMDHDRDMKLADYRRVETVKDIVLIASEEKRVEHWRRGEDSWTVTDLTADDTLRLDSIGFDIAVEALYDGLDFAEAEFA
jgi:Uma2 family endonuclease